MRDWSTYEAEKRAGVYDDEHDDGEWCGDCDGAPCACDDIYDRYREREFDHDEY